MLKDRTNWFAGSNFPQPRRFVLAARQRNLTIGAKDRCANFTSMVKELSDRPPACGLPKSCCTITTPRYGDPSIGAQTDYTDRAFMLEGLADQPAINPIPKSRRLVVAAGERHFPVGGKHRVGDHTLMSERRTDRLARCDVP